MAKAINVVLQKDVDKLGKGGDVVKVAPGYARNFLVPQGLALPASEGNVKRFEHIKRVSAERAAKTRSEATALAEKLAKLDLKISARAGAEGKLYGSITSKDVEAALQKEGIQVDRKKLHVDSIRLGGEYTVKAKLAPEVTVNIKLTVTTTA